MSSLTSARPAVAARLLQKLAADTTISDVQKLDGVNARDLKEEAIVIGNCRSIQAGIDQMKAGRKMRRDEYTQDVAIWACKGSKTPADAKARAAVLLAALENVLAEDATLGGLLHSAEIVTYDGPDAEALPSKGFAAYVDVRIRCVSQLI